MKRAGTWLWMAMMTGAVLLNGCGGGGGATTGVGGTVLERVAIIRLEDPVTKGAVSGAEVYFVTDAGALQMREVVAGATQDPNKISLTEAQRFKSSAKVGDYIRRNVPDEAVFRGIWIKRPSSGYTAVIRHIRPDGTRRVIQTPDSLSTSPGCLLASNLAGQVKVVFGAPGLIDFGTAELFPNRSEAVPPPVDDTCP
ncbi:MAG: hypothetical protein SNJ72_00925 [Fimbriimonadales bacterium]